MSATGYTRQSAANISSGQPITSTPVNNEFNQLQSAFSGGSGHDHSGGSGLGPVLISTAIGVGATTPGIVSLTGTAGAFNHVTITGTSGQIDVSNGTGASGNPTISIDGAYIGQSSITTLGTITIGIWNGTTIAVANGGTGVTSSTGTGSVVLSGSPTFTGTVNGNNLSFTGGGFGSLNVTGASTLNTLATSGATTLGSTLGVTGAVTLSSTLAVTGTSTLGAVTASAINSTPIGGITPSTGAFTTLSSTGNASIGGTIAITGTGTVATPSAADSSTKIATTAFVNSTPLTLANGTTATTQSAGDSSTKVATTGFVNGTALTLTDGTTATTQSSSDSSTKVATTAFVQAILQVIYPVGGLYHSTVSTNPNTLLGFGTWAAFAAGRALIGVGTGTDINSNTLTVAAAQTGGEYTHILSTTEMPSHSHTDLGHTHAPSIGGSVFILGDTGGPSPGVGGAADFKNINSGALTASGTANLQNTGGGGAHNNIQPYVGVYIWKRTA